MRRITLRLAIALLTFGISVTGMSVWYFQQQNVADLPPVEIPYDIEVVDLWAAEARSKRKEISRVKYVYITDTLRLSDEYGELIDSADLVIFYENGVWARTGVSVVAAPKSRLQITSEGHHGYLEMGRWQKQGAGKIIVSVDKCFCSAESIVVTTLPSGEEAYGGGTLELPIEENWHGLLGQKHTAIKSPAGQGFRLLTQREWSDDTNGEIFFAPFEKRAENFGRDCYREDRYWVE